jgi:hypothetical protein
VGLLANKIKTAIIIRIKLKIIKCRFTSQRTKLIMQMDGKFFSTLIDQTDTNNTESSAMGEDDLVLCFFLTSNSRAYLYHINQKQ